MSDARRRLETTGLIAALLVAAAFVASFVFGVLPKRTHEDAPVAADKPLPAAPREAKGKLEVLNASGRSGLARAATLQLRDAGFDVVYFGSTSRANRDSSVVIDRVGRRDVADAAAAALGITTVRAQTDSTLLLDATVIVGTDWRKQQVAAQQATETGWKARLKKWIGR